jgi:SAM-dependent methyltransferase
VTEQERLTSLFFELFTGLPRQGPGDDASTLKALALIPDIRPGTRVLDLGCGTGRPARVLAASESIHILGIDNHPPYIDTANQEALESGLDQRLAFRVGDIRQLELPEQGFDVVWCEGAIYIVGFETGLTEWRRLLRPAGHLVVSEACWMRPNPPSECAAFWAAEYPAIRPVETLLGVVDACGWETVAHFSLPPASWWTDYYGPLQRNLTQFRSRHDREPDAQELAGQVQREIDMWSRYSEYYSYEFIVMRMR